MKGHFSFVASQSARARASEYTILLLLLLPPRRLSSSLKFEDEDFETTMMARSLLRLLPPFFVDAFVVVEEEDDDELVLFLFSSQKRRRDDDDDDDGNEIQDDEWKKKKKTTRRTTTTTKTATRRRRSNNKTFSSLSSSSSKTAKETNGKVKELSLSKAQPSTSGRREEKEGKGGGETSTFPPDHKVFRAKKTMRVPVKERKEALENKASIEHWLKDPNESLGVVFDRNERLSEDEWKVFVASKKKIAFWELSPAFTLEILPDETEFGKQAFRGFDLMLCADEDAEECGWVNDVSVFANIFCQLRVDRDFADEGKEEKKKNNNKNTKYVTPIVVADVDVTIAALLPSFVNAIPGFTNIGEASIAASIDSERRRREKSPDGVRRLGGKETRKNCFFFFFFFF